MANYIKIFNDTVLKQSILQGYQAQRTNTNLGSFTMGELAFTRDTGRVFVGNFTNQTNEVNADSQEVQGGILVGNKYLGMIDSKPLGHYSPNNFPLKYGVKNISSQQVNGGDDEEGIVVEEQGIMLKGSIHRKDKNGGWSKNVEYIEKYDAYSGDYMFDIFNNAFILFDKNITTDETIQPNYSDVMSEKNEQVFLDQNGNTVKGEEVTRRTKIYDNSGERNKNYPIYGDGYVIMRILEPDGVTIGYKDRGFTELGIPKVDKDEKNNTWQNWSHNILELKHVPSTVLIGAMSQDNFFTDGDFVKLNRWQKNIDGFLGTEISIPRSITFASFYNDNKTSNITIKPNGDVNVKDKEARTLTFNINSNDTIRSQSTKDLVLSVDSNNVVTLKEPYRQEFNIALQDGLINPLTGGTTLTLSLANELDNKLSLGFTSSLNLDNDEKGSNNPFYVNAKSDYYYSGNKAYNISGNLILSERWDSEYKEFAKKEIAQFDIEGNVSYNTLKNPIPFCWVDNTTFLQNGTANMQFLIKPYLFCINKEYNIPSITTTDEETGETTTITPTTEEFFGSSTAHNTAISVIGNNGTSHLNIKSDYFVVDGYTSSHDDEKAFDGYTGENSQILYHVPFGDIEHYKSTPTWDWRTTLSQKSNGEYEYQEASATDSTSSLLTKYINHIEDSRTKFKYYYPDIVTATKEDDTNKYEDNYPKLFTLMYNGEQGGFVPTNSSNGDTGLINLSGLIPAGTYIDKIEMSINDKNARTKVICDFIDTLFFNKIMSAKNNDIIHYTDDSNYTDIPLLIKRDEGSNDIYIYALTNSEDFINENTVPYYVKLHTSDGNIRVIPFNSFVELDKISILKYQKDGEDDFFYTFENDNPFNLNGFQFSKLIGVTNTLRFEATTGGILNEVTLPTYQHMDIQTFIDTYAVEQQSNIETVTQVTFNEQDIPERKEVTYNVTRYEIPKSIGSEKSITFIIANNTTDYLQIKKVYKQKSGTTLTKDIKGVDESGYQHMMNVTYNGMIFAADHQGYENYNLMTTEKDSSFTVADDFKVKLRLKAITKSVFNEATMETKYKVSEIVHCPITTEDPENTYIHNVALDVGYDVTSLVRENLTVLFWGTPQQSYDIMNEHKIDIPNQQVTVVDFVGKTFIKKSVPTYKKGYVIAKNISWDDNKVVIPDNASSIICDVHYKSSGTPTTTSIYYADSKENLTSNVDEYVFPFTFTDGKPVQNTSKMGTNQKLIYSNSQSGTEIIEIPLTRFNLNKSKGFCLRLNNVPNKTSSQLVIRIIGYRV